MAWAPPRSVMIGVATVVTLLVLWFLLTTATNVIPATRFPSPADFMASLHQLTFTGYAGGTLDQQVWQSVRLVLLGFFYATIIGVPIGLIMGWSRSAEAFINPTFLLLRPIPPLAWIPLAIVWFGLGDTSKVFVIWLAAFVPAVINTYTGVRNVDRTIIAAARVHGANRMRMLVDVILPGSLPMIFTGLRLSLQASWTTLVAAELVGAFFGLGRVLMIASRDIYPGMILVAMVCVAILGALMTKGLGLIERRVMPWRA